MPLLKAVGIRHLVHSYRIAKCNRTFMKLKKIKDSSAFCQKNRIAMNCLKHCSMASITLAISILEKDMKMLVALLIILSWIL